MKHIIFLMICLIATSNPAFSKNLPTAKKTKKVKSVKETTKYDFSKINQSPFTFKDMGMSDAEFFVTDKDNQIIIDEINRVQDSISELEWTNAISYEPRYLNQKPKTQKQKRAYLKGYLQILEEAKM